MRFYANSLLAMLLLLLAASCGSRERYVKCAGQVWHTEYHATFCGPASLADSLPNVFSRVGTSLSAFDPASLVSRINSGATDSADTHFERVYRAAAKVHAASSGAFDPTVAPLVAAWGFGKVKHPSADTLRIDSLLKFVGMNLTRLDGNRVIKADRRVRFDFSAIAKGYGCDMAGAMLRRNGVSSYLVEVGGEIAVAGNSPSGGLWAISIDSPQSDPDGSRHDSQCVIETTDCGIATSGNYRNFIDLPSGRIAHTVSPATGRPVQTDVVSATVVAADCMTADAFATACMAMTSADAFAMLQAQRLAGMLILADGSVRYTPKFEALIRK